MRFQGKMTSRLRPEKQLFLGLFLFGFILQLLSRSVGIGMVDRIMWANEIKYFLNNDPRAFNFHAAYGHPGTTLLGLGCLFHIWFGFSYVRAVNWAVSILIAAAAAACSVLCFLLYRNSKWWLATAFVLLLNRMYFAATPPSAVEMPLVALIVLYSWWVLEQESMSVKRTSFFLFGVIVGLAAATRLEATLLVGFPLFLLLLHRHGRRVALPFLIGSGVSFFVADPFLWFMPVQHLSDLVHKFLIHYTNSKEIPPAKQDPAVWINYTWLSALGLGWAFALLKKRRLGKIIPGPLVLVFIGISFTAIAGILTSKFQSVRYLFPLNIVWEIFLPLFALKTLAPADSPHPSQGRTSHAASISWGIVIFFALIQLLAYLPLI